jgi:formylmethanofuran--tetrahydromethanopterin N-formyltransferase
MFKAGCQFKISLPHCHVGTSPAPRFALACRQEPGMMMAHDSTMMLGSTAIDDTFAEAFAMTYCRLLITAADEYWLSAAVREVTGYSSSVIACDVEAGLENLLPADQTPDGRIGAGVLMFGFSAKALTAAVPARVGQCVMTCPSTAAYDGLGQVEPHIPLGKQIRFFGDGYQKSKQIDGRRYWRIPVMDGEFLVEDRLGIATGVGGGNIIIQGARAEDCLAGVRRATEQLQSLSGIITPFPGGVARSGSKVGSRYKSLRASTAEAYCPTLRGRVGTRLHPQANSALEIVIDGIHELAVARAMAVAIRAAAGPGIVAISAGNYGGQLGKFHFPLRRLLADE